MLQSITELSMLTASEESPPASRVGALGPRERGVSVADSPQGKGRLPTFILILPNQTPAERGELFASYEWDYLRARKFIWV